MTRAVSDTIKTLSREQLRIKNRGDKKLSFSRIYNALYSYTKIYVKHD
jgi:hypothetical protein